MVMNAQPTFIAGNYFDKYRSRNPLYQRLLRRFLNTAVELIRGIPATSILEVGCGPGDLAARILPTAGHLPEYYMGTDLSEEQIAIARVNNPGYRFEPASIYALPTDDASTDLVIACEVLEHLDAPELALSELHRICRGKVLVSVPNEPLWRIFNVARGRYWTRLGNTPGHLQNFTPTAIRSLCERWFIVERQRQPLPWTMLLLTPRR
jgi:SAM-dependent methyltransferase